MSGYDLLIKRGKEGGHGGWIEKIPQMVRFAVADNQEHHFVTLPTNYTFDTVLYNVLNAFDVHPNQAVELEYFHQGKWIPLTNQQDMNECRALCISGITKVELIFSFDIFKLVSIYLHIPCL